MTHPFQSRRLGDILIAKRWATPEQVDAAASHGDGRLGERLLGENRITAEQLAEALAEQFSLPYVRLNGHVVPSDLF